MKPSSFKHTDKADCDREWQQNVSQSERVELKQVHADSKKWHQMSGAGTVTDHNAGAGEDHRPHDNLIEYSLRVCAATPKETADKHCHQNRVTKIGATRKQHRVKMMCQTEIYL